MFFILTGLDDDEEFGHLDEDLDDVFLPRGTNSSLGSGSNKNGSSFGGSSSNSGNNTNYNSREKTTSGMRGMRTGSGNSNSSNSSSGVSTGADSNNVANRPGYKKNLNMLSAFVHVGGDTIRTLSVIIGAAVSTIFHVDADICDAWAAIVVSVTIVFMVVPLIRDIITSACSLGTDVTDGGGNYTPVKMKEPIL